MKNILSDLKITVGEALETPFMQKYNIYQDGTTPCFRDVDGKLWAISGHTHVGDIAMFSGSTMQDLTKLYPIKTLFATGGAGKAFNAVKYPEGVLPRGSVWPFGLYICPKTHRFFAFFHNETGWNGEDTGYDSFGFCKIPKHDSDFRHIGLMYSDDEGKTWEFDRWVLTGERVCFSQEFNPSNSVVIGQPMTEITLGAGDFSLFVPENDEFMYIVYTMLKLDVQSGQLSACDTYIARSRKRDDGVMGDFVKYYNGAFCEAGNCGKESAIVKNLWHARIIYLKELGVYMLSGSPANCNNVVDVYNPQQTISHALEMRVSNDLTNWSEPVVLHKDGKPFGNHYCAFYSDNPSDSHWESGNSFILQLNGNGTDVLAYKVKFEK